jgi:hypothetical protein
MEVNVKLDDSMGKVLHLLRRGVRRREFWLGGLSGGLIAVVEEFAENVAAPEGAVEKGRLTARLKKEAAEK